MDLFSGAGGLALGFDPNIFRLVYAADSWQPAVETYRKNIGPHIVLDEVRDDFFVPKADVIVGGPPCQGFSSAGRRRPGDGRNTLVAVFARLIAAARPRAFVFENVEGFLTAESGSRVTELLDPLVEAGYRIHLRKVNAANYGVPQHRKRVIAIGGLGWDPTFPEPTHRALGAPGAYRVGGYGLVTAPGVIEALRGLGPPAGEPPGEPSDHYTRPLGGTDLERVHALRPGQTMADLPRSLWHPTFQRRAFRRVKDGTPSDRRGGAPAGLRRLEPDLPSKAITGSARAEFVHPREDRFLTLRECARLQTFPDDFEFAGSAADRAVLIGNSVPPVLAKRVAEALARDLAAKTRGKLPGALLSFTVTNADGLSPALASVVGVVQRRYGLVDETAQLSLCL